jgi:prepilin-type processing-associated H-X9-DG protein/prepilin-type N-terminal cleavage/methylation domain-containing protein
MRLKQQIAGNRDARHRASFTLIELLIVIAVIAILVSLLMPGLKAARDKARAIECGGRLKAIGLANSMYRNDYSDYYPVKGCGFFDSGLLPSWAENFAGNDYLSGEKTVIFRCPSRESSPPDWTPAISYGVNWRNADNNAEWDYFASGKDIKKPSAYVTHADTIYYAGHAKWPNQAYCFGWKKTREGVVQTRHSGGANTVMGDGHVSCLKTGEFKEFSLSYAVSSNNVTETDTTL